QGASVKKITAATGVPRTTVRRMIREVAKGARAAGRCEQTDLAVSISGNYGQPFKWIPVDEKAGLSPVPDMAAAKAQHLQSAGCNQLEESTKNKMDNIYDSIRSLEVSDATDHEIMVTILPLLAQKF